MRLSAECKKLLEEAETRVEVLTKRGGEVVAVRISREICEMTKTQPD